MQLAAQKLDSNPAVQAIVTFGSGLKFTEPRLWRALTVRPAREQEAADWLKRDRLYAYWPNYESQVNAGRRKCRTILRAVIPGYLFMATRDEEIEPSLQVLIRTIPGLIGYIRDGAGNAASLTNDDIELIRKIEAGLNLPPPRRHAHRFKSGDRVRFIDDLLGRWPSGKVAELAGDGRIVIEVPLLGRSVPVRVLPLQIEAI